MSESAKMIELLGLLKREMNGAVTEAMESRGIRYALNYGVSLPTIKKLALRHVCDHELALLLYRQEVRELRIAAFYIADPKQVTYNEAVFWEQGITTSEMAELATTLLIAHSSECEAIAMKWLDDENDLLRYAGLLTAARRVDQNWNIERLLRQIDTLLHSRATSDNGSWRAIARTLAGLNNSTLTERQRLMLGDFINTLRTTTTEENKKIIEELGMFL